MNAWDKLDRILEDGEFSSNEEFLKEAKERSESFLADMEVEREAFVITSAANKATKEIEFAQKDAEFNKFKAEIEAEAASIKHEVNVVEAIHEVANTIKLAKLLRK